MSGKMGDSLIKVEGVSKKFCRDLKRGLWYGVQDLATEFIGRSKSDRPLRKKEFWAVRDVSFEVKRGECLGLIGHNGAGKSTLLKMLNGLLKPDSGRIEIRGRVGALIELGAGFNPLLTGRENIYNNASVLGFSRKETKEKFDSIVAFSEIEKFIDTPVQYYSSGMKVRLGFAVAAHLEPDVLFIDEVLAVGDMGFVLKCFNKMDSLLRNTAIILVSHNIPQIARMSTNILFMKDGSAIYNSTNVSEGITRYYETYKNLAGDFVGSDKVSVRNIILHSSGKYSVPNETFTVEYGQELDISIELSFKEELINPQFWISFFDKEQRVFAEARNFHEKLVVDKIEGDAIFTASFPSIEFGHGSYSVTIALMADEGGARQTLFRFQSAVFFGISGARYGWAPVQLSPDWSVKNLTEQQKLLLNK